MDDSKSTILKRDATGRVSYSPEQRAALLDEFERSGLKGAAFFPAHLLVEGRQFILTHTSCRRMPLPWALQADCVGSGDERVGEDRAIPPSDGLPSRFLATGAHRAKGGGWLPVCLKFQLWGP